MVEGSLMSGTVGMTDVGAEALAAFRAFNYERIYARPASVAQGRLVVEVLRALVEFFAEKPALVPGAGAGGDPVWESVRWVGGMTDRYAFGEAIRRLGWREDRLPVEVGAGSGEWREIAT